MFTEKPKRKRKQQKKTLIRTLFILLIGLPAAFFALRPGLGNNLFTDGIALSVMICAAVYIVQQGILWLIASYLGIVNDDTASDDTLIEEL